MRQRRMLALALAIVLASLLLLLLRGYPARPTQRSDIHSPPASRPSRAEDPAIAAAGAGSTAAPTQKPQMNLAAATAQELRKVARYPRASQPLAAEDIDPILRDRQPSRSVFPGPDESPPTLTVYPAAVSFEHPDPVVLYATLRAVDTLVPARTITGDVVDQSGQHLAGIVYRDDGNPPDEQAGDFVYSARVPEDASRALAGGPYLVRIRAVTTEGEQRNGSTGFLYSRPDAQLTGRYTDAIVAGNLEVQTEIDVQASGRFHVEATLYTQAGTPIAWAQNALVLTPGTQRIPLSFYGLILHERGEDGPYVLRYVALSTTTAMPNALNRLAENAHVTSAYRASEFTDQPYADAHLLATADQLDPSRAAAPADGAQDRPN